MSLTIIRAGQTRNIAIGADVDIREANADSAAAWWTANGTIPAGDIAGVWAAKGAASLAASYLRLAGDQGYANIDPAIVGGVAPTWDAVTGWKGDGSSAYLKTGIIPVADQSYSMFIRYATANNDSALAGAISGVAGGGYFFIQAMRTAGAKVLYSNGDFIEPAPGLATGTLSISGNKGYRNGLVDTGTIGAWTAASTKEIYILAVNSNGSPGLYTSAYITHFAVYKSIITAPQNAALTAATA